MYEGDDETNEQLLQRISRKSFLSSFLLNVFYSNENNISYKIVKHVIIFNTEIKIETF